jgi:transcriptional regulator with XRE-family HTH domain
VSASGEVGDTIGYQLRRLRRLRGLTQEELADRANVSRDLVAKLEQGRRHTAHITSLASLARALDVELSALVEHAGRAPEAEEGDATGVIALEGNGLTWLAPERGATPAPSAHAPRRPEGFDKLVAALVRRDVAPTVERRIDLAALTRGAASAKRNLQACRYGLAIGELARLLSLSSMRAHELDGDRALRVWALRAHACQTAASVLLRLGHNGLAFIAATRSMESAERSQDQLVIGSSARALAHAFLSSGHAREARMTAMSAAARLDGLDRTHQQRSVLGSLLLRAAVAAARDGDRSAALELLDRADVVASFLGEDGNYRWTAFGPANVLLHRVHVAVAFGDAGTALDYARSIDVSRLAVVERRAGLYIDAAKALVQLGKHADACHMLAVAERLAPEELTSRSSVRALIGDMARSAPRSAQPTVRALAVRAGADL